MNTSAFAAVVCLGGMFTASTGFCAGHDEARTLREAGTILPLEHIISRAHDRYIGHILEAELESGRSGYYYEVELVDDAGIVRKLRYDAESGELLSDSLDD